MRVLFVVHQYFPYFVTGVERDTQNLASQLRKMGHSTTVLSAVPASLDPGSLPRRYFFEGTDVVQVAVPRREGSPSDHVRDAETVRAVESVLEKTTPDVVHVMHPRYFPEARSVATSAGIPVVVHLHDYWYCCPRIQLVRAGGELCTGSGAGKNCESVCHMAPGAGVGRHEWARQELAAADAVISPSRFLADVFASEGFDTSYWHLIPYGVDYRNLRAPDGGQDRADGRLVVRFLGTLLRHKGPDVAVRAIRQIQSDKVELRVHGSSYHESDYEAELRELAAGDDRISFEGPYEYRDLGKILSATDLVVVPSVWYENLPITALTAAAMRVPLVASDLGGMKEIVETYRAGFLFRPGDPESLAAIISEVAADRAALEELRGGIVRPPSVEEEAHRVDLVYSDL